MRLRAGPDAQEDVHQLPEHVVGGLLHLLDDPGSALSTAKEKSASLRAAPAHRDRKQTRRALAGTPPPRVAPAVRRERDVTRRARQERRSADRLGLRGESTLAHDHRVHELDGDVAASVAAAPVPYATSVPPREKARAIAWQDRAGARSRRGRIEHSLPIVREPSQPAGLFDRARAQLFQLLLVRIAEALEELARHCASCSSIFDIAKPTWISTQSPTPTASAPSRAARR